MFIADLHTHTNYSDGVSTIDTLLEEALAAGITHLAMTDHDTVFHIPLLMEKAEGKPIEIIPGLEMSLFDYTVNRRVHMLGLFFPMPVPPNVDKSVRELNARREAYHRLMVERFNAGGYPLDFDTEVKPLAKENIVYKMHIFIALYEKHLKHVPDLDIKAFYMEHFGKPQSKADDDLVAYPDIQTGINLILQDGGIPVIAHPNLYDSFDQIEGYIAMGMQGIECYHPHMMPEDTERALAIAKKYNLYVTGGTDCHGKMGLGAEGMEIGSCGLTQEGWDRLLTKVNSEHRNKK